MPITEAYNPEMLSMNYPELLKESEKVFGKFISNIQFFSTSYLCMCIKITSYYIHSQVYLFLKATSDQVKNWKKKQGNNQVSKLGLFIELDG